MKKTLALLLVCVMCLGLCSCGGVDTPSSNTDSSATESNNKTGSVSETDLVGEWYEVKSAKRLILNGDGSSECYKTSGIIPYPGTWKLNNGVVCATNYQVDDLSVESNDGTLSLKNDEYTFMRWDDISKDELSIGESGNKESISITVENVEFTTTPPNPLLNSPFERDIDEFALQDGMTYAKISTTITNMSKYEINVPDLSLKLDMLLNYNNGYIYAIHDNQKSFFSTDTDYVIHEGPGSQTGKSIQIQPLQSKLIDVYIPCPEAVANDEDAPLTLGIISRYDAEIYYCEYTIR